MNEEKGTPTYNYKNLCKDKYEKTHKDYQSICNCYK